MLMAECNYTAVFLQDVYFTGRPPQRGARQNLGEPPEMHLYQTAGEREMGKGPVKLGQPHNVSQAATVGGENGAPAVSHMLVPVLKQAAKQSDIIACPNQKPPNVGFPPNFNS